MLYINGVPLIFNKTIRPKKIFIYFVIILLILILLSFISIPDLSNTGQRKYPLNWTYTSHLNENIKLSTPNIQEKLPIFKQNIIRNKYLFSQFPSALDEINEHRRSKVKEMMKFAWNNYVKYAFEYNELKPISKRPHLGSVFGRDKLGLTIVDSLDTLLLMNLTNEYILGYRWVMTNLSFENTHSAISVFETNIRYIGGLISLYFFTGDHNFVRKAEEIGQYLMPAFDTPEGLPFSTYDRNNNRGRNYAWANGESFILSEIGTLHLEYILLSKLSGNPIYAEKVMKIRNYLTTVYTEDGLVNNYINPASDKNKKTLSLNGTNYCGDNQKRNDLSQSTSRPALFHMDSLLKDDSFYCQAPHNLLAHAHVSLGGLGDSYYEYLLKSYVISNHEDLQAKKMFDDALNGIRRRLIKSSPSHLVYVAQIRNQKIEDKMDHLACFFGGLMALSSQHETDSKASSDQILLAQHITETCRMGYANSPIGLAPEVLQFDKDADAVALNTRDRHYILRPETFESYFYLWRLTKDPKYREWAWDAVQNLNNYTRVAAGFSGVKNVYPHDLKPEHDDVQQSYFMSESLKYLYLIFCPDELLPLDYWVFNTEGHPFLRHDLIDTAFSTTDPEHIERVKVSDVEDANLAVDVQHNKFPEAPLEFEEKPPQGPPFHPDQDVVIDHDPIILAD